jgi:hypothetical protein
MKSKMMAKLAWQDGSLPVKLYDDVVKPEVVE